MSIALREPPDLDREAGGIVARRAVIRWGWRLFRREWQKSLIMRIFSHIISREYMN